MRILTTLALACVTTFCIGQNLIPNADWEIGPDTSSDPFNGWISYGPAQWTRIATPDRIVNNSPAISRDKHPAFSGKAYCVFYGPTPEGGTATLTSGIINGSQYTFSCYLNCDSNFLGGPGGLIVSFTGANSFTTKMVNTPGQWVRWDTTFIASGNSSTITLTATGNNLAKIDSMFLGISFPTGVKEVPAQKVEVWPNPAHDMIRISGPPGTAVEIRDLSGKLVKTVATNQEIKLTNWCKGLYFAKVHASAGVKVKKFVVQ